MCALISPNPAEFIRLGTLCMPYGKYKGQRLVDLPEPYLVWFSRKGFPKGFPKGRLGEDLKAVYEIKRNGLEYLFNSGGL